MFKQVRSYWRVIAGVVSPLNQGLRLSWTTYPEYDLKYLHYPHNQTKQRWGFNRNSMPVIHMRMHTGSLTQQKRATKHPHKHNSFRLIWYAKNPNKQLIHMVIYINTNITIVLHCWLRFRLLFHKSPPKNSQKQYSQANAGPAWCFFQFSVTKQSFRNKLKGGEQIVKLLSA